MQGCSVCHATNSLDEKHMEQDNYATTSEAT